jgi:HD-GYP domain-containing protein (c-di-GMP phosphodiesterase class II)
MDELETSESPWNVALALEPQPHTLVAEDKVDDVFATLGDFADLKSLYTAGNASAVADLAARAAARCSLSEDQSTLLRRAAYVQDVGRVGVTTAIWDKTGPLTRGEWEKVRLHPYLSERVVARSEEASAIGHLASLHHESLDGSGYHRGTKASDLDLPARVLHAADRYQAMTSRRSWRGPLEPEVVAAELQKLADSEVLDGRAVAAVLEAAGHHTPRRLQHVAGLTERELEVLDLVASGYTTKEIAARLVISRKTADHHIQNIYTKLDVSTRPAATLFAMQHGLVGVSKMG